MKSSLSALLFVALGLASCGGRSSAEPDIAEEAFKVEISSPDPDSERGRALALLDEGSDFALLSLQSWEPPVPPPPPSRSGGKGNEVAEAAHQLAWDKSQREWCSKDECLQEHLVLGRVQLRTGTDIEKVKTIARLSLSQVPNYGLACAAQYRHGIEYAVDGRKVQILLCYECGKVAAGIDGKFGYDEQTYEMGDEGDLDAILRKANIPLAPKPLT